MFRFTLIACLWMSLALAQGQDAKPRIFKAVRSPEVLSDGRVALRFYAPNAQKVSASLDGKSFPMAKDANGVWSAITATLTPDIYSYFFLVDGVQFGDPANTLIKPIVTGGSDSLLHVPGPKTLPWEENDVPHGVVHRHRYWSKVVGEFRDFLVYTPPGYDAAAKKDYPSLYLLHGVMDDESAWITAGRANVILDNLIAQRKAKPMLLVMPLGYGFPNAPDRVGDVLSGKTNHQEDMERLSRILFEEVQPQVEKSYRASRKREGRAIAGLSMGGAQALYLGLAHFQRFGFAASFSGAFVMFGASLERWLPNLKGKDSPKLTIACGKEDFLLGSNRQTQAWLRSKGVAFEAQETAGAHTWSVWRRNLAAYLPSLFAN